MLHHINAKVLFSKYCFYTSVSMKIEQHIFVCNLCSTCFLELNLTFLCDNRYEISVIVVFRNIFCWYADKLKINIPWWWKNISFINKLLSAYAFPKALSDQDDAQTLASHFRWPRKRCLILKRLTYKTKAMLRLGRWDHSMLAASDLILNHLCHLATLLGSQRFAREVIGPSQPSLQRFSLAFY